ncbi:hypothetical protein NEF87_002026 [Candidatus Lokiarchaeum ossiferum]|uniref:HTH arsR-type domain-containing protein n=1 Tax=Candidatus Lokiarchaeum ossiferum TaxID=2951803 RepID=A0ABY6HQP8_9ARCH|nr:hypothetical protein NEF87_002026 [Candidatus Lokiarchaeum sp. B-35]
MSLPTEEIFIQAISHEIRRNILRILLESPKSFTDLLNFFDISSSKLTYHLKHIQGFIEKDVNQFYIITALGKRALNVLDSIKKDLSPEDQPLLKEAYQGQKTYKTSLAVQGMNIIIGTILFTMIISSTILIITMLDPQTPWIIYPISILILGIECSILIWAIKTRKTTPQIMNKLKKHFEEPL